MTKGYWNRKNRKKRLGYLVMTGIILFGIFLIGYDTSVKILPQSINATYFEEFEHFSLDIAVSNKDNPENALIRETDSLKFDITVTNKDSDAISLSYYDEISQVRKTVFPKRTLNEIIEQGEFSFTRYLPLEKAGMNTIYLDFKIYEYIEPKSGYGGLQKSPQLLEEKTLSYEPRVLSESEYSYQIERHALYFWLWVVAAPFVLLGVKTFRDLLEGK